MKADEYVKAMENVKLSAEAQRRILLKSREVNDKKERYTKMSKTKTILIAIAAVMVLGITALAASGDVMYWNTSSKQGADYTSLPTAEQCLEDVGFEPCLLEKFENGYTFAEGDIEKNTLKDENKNDVGSFGSIAFQYEKDGDTVIFAQYPYVFDGEVAGEVKYSEDGIDVYYNAFTQKIVPVDYEMTDEDMEAVENSDLVLSYGADEIVVYEVQGVSWTIDGMQYVLTQLDGALTADDLIEMARELIAVA